MKYPFTVELQPPFSFRIVWFFIGLALLLAALVLLILWIRKYRRSSGKDLPEIRQPSDRDRREIRRKYLAELRVLEEQFGENRASVRETYQSLSSLVRRFAFEMTGIRLQELTLSDIRRLHMPVLTRLVEEYYVPEFADYQDEPASPELHGAGGSPAASAESRGRRVSREFVQQSLQNTRKAIERWR